MTRYYNFGTTVYNNFDTGYPYLSVNIRKIIRLMNEVRDHPRNDSVVDCSCPELSELIG